MSDFVPTEQTEQASIPDPNKHVRYSYGMVLGKEDLEQDFAFHHGRDLWGMREVIGYGTVRGLAVKAEDDGAQGPRISVMPGSAITPRGELVCVPSEQCASLNDWLKKQARDAAKRTLLEGKITADQLTLYVTLCYRDCPTDDLPIPGEPCRDEADAMAPSRLTDDFALELHLDPPDQLEEEGVRDFVTWLRAIPLNAGAPDTPEALAAFADAVRSAFSVDTTTVPPEVAFHSPPAPPAPPTIPSSNSKEFYRAAFRVWVTDIRPRQDGLGQFIDAIRGALSHTTTDDSKAVLPTSERAAETRFIEAIKRAAGLSRDHTTPGLMDPHEFDGLLFSAKPASLPEYWRDAWTVWDEVLQRWMARSAQCAWPPEESCVLLSRIALPLTAADANNERRVDGNATAVKVSDQTRPYLAHLRVLQEWLLSDVNEAGIVPAILLDGDVTDEPNKNRVIKIQNTPVSAVKPTQDQILQFDGAEWVPADLPAGGGGAPPPAIVLGGDVVDDPAANKVSKIQHVPVSANAPNQDEILTFDAGEWKPKPLVLVGDVVVNPGENKVVGLNQVPVSATAPTQNQVLTFINGEWVPANPLVADPGKDNVTKPANLPLYQIVAAGIVRGNGTARVPVFNDLTMRAIGPGSLRLRFNGYEMPNDSFQYIVKAIGVTREVVDLTIVFSDFTPEGILMGAILRNKPVQDVEALELMVEISRYER